MSAKTNGVASHDENDTVIQRPPDIEQDMKEMERRKRVDMIMNSQIFREELEKIIESQLNEGYLPASLSALQQVTELLLPSTARNSVIHRSGSNAVAINDIRGVDGLRYAKGEKLLRCKLAAVYRLVDLYGWSEGIYNHISVRLSQELEHFLINPFGLQYHEVTASSLLKVDMQGSVVDPGSTNFGFNKAGFVLHSAIHQARPDIKAIIHIHYSPCVAVSAMKCGFLPISQEAAIVGNVSYHDFNGILVDTKERELIGRNLGFNKVLFLRNHGVVTCGETLEEALYLMQNVVLACETQIKLSHVGLDNIHMMSEESIEQVRSIIKSAGSQVQGSTKGDEKAGNVDAEKGADEQQQREKPRKWKIWDLEFEAQMRMLDNSGYRTGYIYRQPLLRADQQRAKYDVEIPPSASSGTHLEDDRWLSPLKKLVDGRKTQDKLRWVNTPNVYQKVEITETGTNDPKKITKWVQEASPSHNSNPIKIDNAHQFVPVNANPAEFKKKQKELKENRLQNKISGGPQSHILEGGGWSADTEIDASRQTNEPVMMIGAASKGIIQREFQHNAMVYKSAYSKNPFDNVSDQEIEDYKQMVERRQRGEPVDDLPDHVKHLLLEPVAEKPVEEQVTSPKSPTSPMSDESKTNNRVQRSHSARLAAKDAEDKFFARDQRYKSERKVKSSTSETAVNGEDRIGDHSRSSKEGSPVKDLSTSEKSDKKDKKKKGVRSLSFLSKKSKKKDKKEEKSQA